MGFAFCLFKCTMFAKRLSILSQMSGRLVIGCVIIIIFKII